MTTDKETIYAALWARLTGTVTGTVVQSRRVRHWDSVDVTEQPAMFMEQIGVNLNTDGNRPSKEVLQAKVVFYAYKDDVNGPMPVINGLVSQVENLTKKQAGEVTTSAASQYYTNLGGLVSSARVTNIEFGGGNLGNQGVGVVTIELLTAT